MKDELLQIFPIPVLICKYENSIEEDFSEKSIDEELSLNVFQEVVPLTSDFEISEEN